MVREPGRTARGRPAVGGAAITIRPMRPGDCRAVRHLCVQAGLPVEPAGRDAPQALLRQRQRFGASYLVAERDGRLVGVVLGTHDQRKGWINRLAVHPGCRRQGLGRRLLAACEQALRAEGIALIAALVERGNGPALSFFRRAGYLSDVPVHYFRKRVRAATRAPRRRPPRRATTAKRRGRARAGRR